ncbi:MAG: hypothetical protein MAGBODY4_01526 [Candidatus Marinimicrobia bacterium]|nr:hypothetical protein [Candidatus Neomarinimicrobiota bacterium]
MRVSHFEFISYHDLPQNIGWIVDDLAELQQVIFSNIDEFHYVVQQSKCP